MVARAHVASGKKNQTNKRTTDQTIQGMIGATNETIEMYGVNE